MKDLGELKWFLGVEFRKSTHLIKISQKTLKEYLNILAYQIVNHVPCTEDINKEKEESPELSDLRVYREIVGNLIYAMTATRPDISYMVNELSQKMSNPTERDLSLL